MTTFLEIKKQSFFGSNLFYNEEQDFLSLHNKAKIGKCRHGKATSSNGYESQVTYYHVKNGHNYQLCGSCHHAKGNRRIEVNHRLNEPKERARNLLTREEGLKHRSRYPVEVEAILGN